MSEAIEKLPDSISITLNGQQQEFFMSFNKLNRCSFLIGDIENLVLARVAPSLREAILCDFLAPKGTTLKLDDLDINPNDAQRVLDFVGNHVLDFTLGALEQATALQARNESRVSKYVKKV